MRKGGGLQEGICSGDEIRGHVIGWGNKGEGLLQVALKFHRDMEEVQVKREYRR